MSPVRTAIQLLLQRPSLARTVPNPGVLADLDQPGAELLAELVAWLKDRPDATPGQVVEHWRDSEHVDALGKLATAEQLIPDAGIEAEFAEILARLGGRNSRQRLEQQIDELKARAAAGQLDEAGKTELKRLLAALK